MTQIEVLKDSYILIMHMVGFGVFLFEKKLTVLLKGRQYSFDMVAKGFSTLPLVEQSTGYLLSNFDLLFNTMSNQVACFDQDRRQFGSDPGVYVCSTDMVFFPASSG